MDNYVKGEENDVDNSVPFDEDLLSNVPTIKIKANAKVHNICNYAENLINQEACQKILFIGVGSACSKTISCVEVFKRNLKFTLHQMSKAVFKRIEEFWEPLEKGLDRLKVNRDVPALFILLSKDPFERDDPSYQSPGDYVSPPFCVQRQPTVNRNRQQRQRRKSADFPADSRQRRDNVWKRQKQKDKMNKPKNYADNNNK